MLDYMGTSFCVAVEALYYRLFVSTEGLCEGTPVLYVAE